MLIQLRDANWRIPYIGGWCEGYVEGAWGQATLPKQDSEGNWFTSGVWASAMAKWNANPGNGNHPGELPPVGKTVAVYFSLGSTPDGHTAISLDDGKVASSTQGGVHSQGYIHPNIQDLINVYAEYNNGCTYLGWSEYVGNIQVVQFQSDKATDDQIRQAYRDILEREADDGGIIHYRAYTNDQVRADLMASNERQIVVARHVAEKAAADEAARQAEIARLKALQDAADAKALEDAQSTIPRTEPTTEAPSEPKPIEQPIETPKEETMALSQEQHDAIVTQTQNIVDELQTVSNSDEVQKLVNSISDKTKLIVYLAGDTLLGLGAIAPQLVVLFTTHDTFVLATTLSSTLATAGLFILTMFGIYKSGK